MNLKTLIGLKMSWSYDKPNPLSGGKPKVLNPKRDHKNQVLRLKTKEIAQLLQAVIDNEQRLHFFIHLTMEFEYQGVIYGEPGTDDFDEVEAKINAHCIYGDITSDVQESLELMLDQLPMGATFRFFHFYTEVVGI